MFDSNVFELQNNIMSDFNRKRKGQNQKLNVYKRMYDVMLYLN